MINKKTTDDQSIIQAKKGHNWTKTLSKSKVQSKMADYAFVVDNGCKRLLGRSKAVVPLYKTSNLYNKVLHMG